MASSVLVQLLQPCLNYFLSLNKRQNEAVKADVGLLD